jgi:hypothetical protein
VETAKSSDRTSWFLIWCIVSSIGAGAGVISWIAVGSVLEAAGGGSLNVLTAFAAGSAFGTVFGLAQWLVLKKAVPGAGRWVIACLVGYGIDFVLGATLLPPESGANLGAAQTILLGVLLGAAVALLPATLQWLLVLKNQFSRAAWWIPASLASWGLGFAVSFGLRLLFGELTFVAGPVVAIGLTGLAMRRLLRRSL